MAWGELLSLGLEWAVERHRGVFRDGEFAVPYACHPVEVMLTLRNVAGVTDEEVLTAALLHDLVEDTETTLGEIRYAFGDRVADLVGEVTREEPSASDVAGMSKEEVWEVRNRILMGELARMSDDALRIKLADRLSNVREARLTRTGFRLERYVMQTRQILGVVRREVCPGLWDLVAGEVG